MTLALAVSALNRFIIFLRRSSSLLAASPLDPAPTVPNKAPATSIPAPCVKGFIVPPERMVGRATVAAGSAKEPTSSAILPNFFKIPIVLPSQPSVFVNQPAVLVHRFTRIIVCLTIR